MLSNLDLNRLATRISTEMRNCGFDTENLNNTKFFFVRQTRTSGVTKRFAGGSFVVEISNDYKYVETREQFDSLVNTVAHEMLHVVDGLQDMTHNGTWLSLAKKWNATHTKRWEMQETAHRWETECMFDIGRKTNKYTLEMYRDGEIAYATHYPRKCKITEYARKQAGAILHGEERFEVGEYRLVQNY